MHNATIFVKVVCVVYKCPTRGNRTLVKHDNIIQGECNPKIACVCVWVCACVPKRGIANGCITDVAAVITVLGCFGTVSTQPVPAVPTGY